MAVEIRVPARRFNGPGNADIPGNVRGHGIEQRVATPRICISIRSGADDQGPGRAAYCARDCALVSCLVAGSFPGLASNWQSTGDGILDEFRAVVELAGLFHESAACHRHIGYNRSDVSIEAAAPIKNDGSGK